MLFKRLTTPLMLVLALAFVSPVYVYAQDPVTAAPVVVDTAVSTAPAPEAVVSPEAAIAAEQDTSATIYVGNLVAYFVDNLKNILLTLILGAITVASASLPGFAGIAIRFFMANMGEKFITNLLDHGINAIKGATKDQKIEVNVGSAVIAEAIERMTKLENLDPWLKKLISFLGGKTGVAEKMFRKMDLAPDATKENVLGAALSKSGLPYRA